MLTETPIGSEDLRVRGRIVSINESQTPLEGPVQIVIRRTNDTELTISIPQTGFNPCAASPNIASLDDLKVGTLVEVLGSEGQGGEIVPCRLSNHYLKIIEDDSTTTPAVSGVNFPSGPEIIETRIDQGASALGVKVVPLEVLEDSRCPADVQCIWAGQVRLRALLSSGLGTGEQIFTLFQPITTESEIVRLVKVEPAPRSGVVLKPGEYIFEFEIKKR